MRKIALFFCLLFAAMASYAQFSKCGTPDRIKQPIQGTAARVSGPTSDWSVYPACKKATIQIVVHVVRKADGTGGFNDPNIHNSLLASLNGTFNQHNIWFVLKDPNIDYINSTEAYSKTYNDLGSGNNNSHNADGKFDNFNYNTHSNAIDVYFLGNSTFSSPIGMGVAADYGSTAIIYSGQEGWAFNDIQFKTISHEMGHCLGLYHTFIGTACNARPDGSLCEIGGMVQQPDPQNPGQFIYVYNGNGDIAGDYVRDTWADPTSNNAYYPVPVTADCRIDIPIEHSFFCQSPFPTNDPLGFPWKPLMNNFMDYDYASQPGTSTPVCPFAFTPGQVDRMLKAIANDANVNATVVKETSTVSISSSGGGLNQCTPVTIDLTAQSPSTQYYYNWSTGQSNAPALTNLSPAITTTYTVTAASRCMANEPTASITVHVNDDVQLAIIGDDNICEGSTSATSTGYTAHDNANTGNMPPTGTWSISNGPSSVTIDNHGFVTVPIGVTGTFEITYTSDATSISGCQPIAKKVVNIVPQTATVGIAASDTEICTGQEVTLTATGTVGLSYLWSPGGQTTSSIQVNPTQTTTYTLVATLPCGTILPTQQVTINVHPFPVVGSSPANPVPAEICMNSPTLLNYSVIGNPVGTWDFTGSSTTGASYTYDANTHQLTGTAAGNLQYTYTFTLNGCSSIAASGTLRIYPNTLAVSIAAGGSNTICSATQLALSANIPGGTWSSSNPGSVAVHPTSGVVTGILPGTSATISYTTAFCGTVQTAPITINVNTDPSPAIIQSKNTMCKGTTYQFVVGPSGGVWDNFNSPVASVDASGNVTANQIGSVTLAYSPTLPFTTCFTDPVYFTVDVEDCTPVDCEHVQAATIPGNTVSGNFYDGFYAIDENLTITGTMNFGRCQVSVRSGVEITLADNAVLNISGSHFYTCSGMWKGIKVTGNNARLSITNNGSLSSVIEDAEIAVLYKPASPSQTYTGTHFLNIHGTIFNRNKLGIQIENLETVANLTGNTLPISVYNCIFTSRDLAINPGALSWDNVDAIKATTTSINTAITQTPLSYEAPYIDNSTYSDAVANAYLKDGAGTNKPDAGIIIKYTGTKTANGQYKNVQIGAPTVFAYPSPIANTNIFDNLGIGIRSTNSNLVVYNSTFQKGALDNVNKGVGIAAVNSGPIVPPGFTQIGEPPIPPNFQGINTGYTEISTPAGSYNNAFFDMSIAITLATKKMVAEQCDIRSNEDVNTQTDAGNNGIVLGGNNYSLVRANYNKLYNIRNGIWFNTSVVDRNPNISEYGTVEINNNEIADAIPTYNILSGSYLKNAITLSYAHLYGGYTTQVSCSYNKVTNAVYGIKLSGFRGSMVNNNEVKITNDKTGVATNQYGICLEGGIGMLEVLDANNPNPVRNGDGSTTLHDNLLEGPGMTVNSTGILLNQQMKANIGCNQVGGRPLQSGFLGFTHGFRFVGTNPQTRFWDNTMYTTNQYGMTLWDDGVIDRQGTVTITAEEPYYCASNNSWEQDANYWNSLSQSMTNCQSSDATKSKLVVRNSSSPSNGHINPQGSGLSSSNTLGERYSIADGSLLYATQPDNANCIRCASAQSYNRSQNLLEEIADGTVSLPNDDAEERLMVMQQQLYDLLQEHPDLIATSNSLQQFVLNSQWSSFDYIYYAGKYLALGDTASVQLLLDTWPGQTALDDAYIQYFEWLKTMYENPEWRPELNEVWDLANRCPLKYGTVVYAVRNLYNALTGEIHYFEGSCEGVDQSRGTNNNQGKKFIRLKQPKQQVPEIPVSKGSLKLYPNPSNGIVNVQYSKMKLVVVTDMAGRVLKQQQVNGLGNIQMNLQGLPKGVYLIKVLNQENATETQKLLVQ